MKQNRQIYQGEIYKHFKNKLYQIITIAWHSETSEKYVVYQALYGDFRSYIRPYEMFISEVDHQKYPDCLQKYRFEKIDILENEKENTTEQSNQKKEPAEKEKVDEIKVNERLMEFFDQPNTSSKIEYLKSVKKYIDDKMINDIAASMDITIDEGDLEKRIYSLLNCMQTIARFESTRLR